MGGMQMRKVVSTFTYNKKDRPQSVSVVYAGLRSAVYETYVPLCLFLKGECVVQF